MTSKDDAIVYFANDFHLVTRSHLANLTGRNPKSLNESLRRLVKAKRLYCKPQGIYKPHVYATYNICKRQYFNHDLGITDVHLALHNTSRLIEWQQRQEKRKGELNEDAVFYLAVPLPDRIGRIKYYLEYDTGTEPLWQIDEKFSRYLAARDPALEPFHVLFVCQEKSRMQRFSVRAQKFLNKEKTTSPKFFLFTAIQDIVSDTQGAICRIAFDKESHPIAPDSLPLKQNLWVD